MKRLTRNSIYTLLRKRHFRNLRPLQHAPVVLRRLAYVHKVRVRIITHRLFIPRFHETAINQTVEWLDKYGIPYWDLCFMKDKAGVGADLYIEDSPTNIKALRGTAMIRLSMPTQQMSALKARVQTTGSRSRSWSWKRLPVATPGRRKAPSVRLIARRCLTKSWTTTTRRVNREAKRALASRSQECFGRRERALRP